MNLRRIISKLVFLTVFLLVWGKEVHTWADTEVGGIIDSDTTWTFANSPYDLINNVQIAYGATLSLEPGVVVNGNDYAIQVWGVLDAIGNNTSKITFENTYIKQGVNNLGQSFLINVQFSKINNGSIYSNIAGSYYGSLILRDSELINTPVLLIHYPTSDCYIERNIFVNADGIIVEGGAVYIRNNVFYQQNGNYFGYGNYAVAGVTGSAIVEYNSFLSTDRIALMIVPGYSGSIIGINNYWDTTDTNVIDSMIYDRHDNLACASYIDYLPILTEPHPDTPIPEITPPLPGAVIPTSSQYNTFVDSPFNVTATFTDNESDISACEYCKSTDGNCDTEWTTAILSGSKPTWTCFKSGITGTNGQALMLNMRATSSGGTGTATAITRTVDSARPITTNNSSSAWTSLSPVTVTLSPSDGSGSGVATTKYCVDTTNSCTPNTSGTSVNVNCALNSDCVQYVRYFSRDNVSNKETTKSRQIRQDLKPPTDGTLSATKGDAQVALNWGGFSEGNGSGLKSTGTYKAMRNTGTYPNAQCTNGAQIYLGSGNSKIDTGLTNGITYYYRVCAYDNAGNISTGATANATPVCQTPATPVLLSPVDNSQDTSATPTLDWSNVSGATSYDVRVCSNSTCSSVKRSKNVTSSQWTVSPALNQGAVYYWRVRSRNACGASSWSSTRSFTTCSNPSPPSLVSPVNGATGVSTTPKLDWGSVPGATSYAVQVCSDSSCATVVRSKSVTNSQWTVSPTLNKGKTYYWRIRSKNSCGAGAWSSIRKFTTSGH